MNTVFGVQEVIKYIEYLCIRLRPRENSSSVRGGGR